MSLVDPQIQTAIASLVPAVIALGGVFVGAMLSARLSFRNQFRIATLQARQQAYAALMGKRFLITQLYVSRFEAHAYSDYHERLWNLVGSPKESLDLEEAQRWMRKSEELVSELAKANQSLFESVGVVRATFAPTSELENLSERVYHFRTPVVKAPPAGTGRVALDQWKQNVIPELQALVQHEYAEPIEALTKYLRLHIAEPVR